MAHHVFVTHPIILRRLDVVRVVDVTPRMRRVTLTGDQLAAFERDGLSLPAFVSDGFDDHVKLVLAEGGDLETALPVQRAQSIDWPDAPHARTRDYTPRRWDAGSAELDLDFVRHGDGPAARWAEAAVPGDVLHVVGPKSSTVVPEDVDWVLLAGDETALPAIGRYLDERPSDARVQVVVEVRDPDARQDLALREGDTLRWVEIGEHAPSALAAAVAETAWWPGEVFAWAAGESRSLLPLRRWLTRTQGVPKTHQDVTGYWTAERSTPSRDATVADDSARATEDDGTLGTGPTATPVLEADLLLSPLPWLATRAALDLGILDLVADAPRSVEDLALAAGVPAATVQALVDYLSLVEVVEVVGVLAVAPETGGSGRDAENASAQPGLVSLGPVGEHVLDEDVRDEMEDGLESRLVSALDLLAPAVRSGTSAYARLRGRTLLTDLQEHGDLFAEQVDAERGFQFVSRGVADLGLWDASVHAAVTGAGAAGFVDAAGLDAVRFTVVESEAALAVVGAATLREDVTRSTVWPMCDVAVSALALRYRTDLEVVELLRQAGSAAARLVVVERLADSAPLTLHDAEHGLLDLAGTGTPERRVADVVRLASSAGWSLDRHTSLGWTYEVLELVRL